MIEPLSLDEAYLDVTHNFKGLASATEVAMQIRANIFSQTGLTASAGVAPNKFLAKVASDWNKPDGIFVVKPHQIQQFIEHLERSARFIHIAHFHACPTDFPHKLPIEILYVFYRQIEIKKNYIFKILIRKIISFPF